MDADKISRETLTRRLRKARGKLEASSGKEKPITAKEREAEQIASKWSVIQDGNDALDRLERWVHSLRLVLVLDDDGNDTLDNHLASIKSAVDSIVLMCSKDLPPLEE